MDVYVKFRKGVTSNTNQVYDKPMVNVDRNSCGEIIGIELLDAIDVTTDGLRALYKGSAEQKTDNNSYITALERLKLPERGEKRRGWNEGIEACIEEIQRFHSLKAPTCT